MIWTNERHRSRIIACERVFLRFPLARVWFFGKGQSV